MIAIILQSYMRLLLANRLVFEATEHSRHKASDAVARTSASLLVTETANVNGTDDGRWVREQDPVVMCKLQQT